MERLMVYEQGHRTKIAASLALGLGLACSGCVFGAKKQPKVFTLPPAPAVVPPPPADAKPLETPPSVVPTGIAPVEIPQAGLPKPTPPAPGKAPARPARVRPAPVPANAGTPVVTPPLQGSPMPQLGELLTPAQRRQAEVDFVSALQRARASLSRVNGRALSGDQRDTAERVRVFIGQAEAEKSRDIATALQLARRADLLGQDLLKAFPQ